MWVPRNIPAFAAYTYDDIPQAVSALSSVGLSLNCGYPSCSCFGYWAHTVPLCLFSGIINFGVGLVFLPLRNILSGGDPDKEGRVFYVFASMLAFCTFVLLSVYRG